MDTETNGDKTEARTDLTRRAIENAQKTIRENQEVLDRLQAEREARQRNESHT